MLGEMFAATQGSMINFLITMQHQPTILTMEYIQQHGLHISSIEISCYILIHIRDR